MFFVVKVIIQGHKGQQDSLLSPVRQSPLPKSLPPPPLVYFIISVCIDLDIFFLPVVICIFPIVTEGGWQTWGQWKQSAPGVRARIRTKDTQDQCPHKYQGTVK